MANRQELQNKGTGRHKDINGRSAGPGTSHKGMSRVIRDNKRDEALDRNKLSAPDTRRSYWRELGFARKSEAARIVKDAVAEGIVISRTIVPDVA